MSISDDQSFAFLDQHEDDEGFRFDLLYVFEIENPAKRNGGNVVLTPSSTVPPVAEMDPSARDQLDAGTAAFVFSVLSVPGDVSDHETSDMLGTDHERHEEEFQAYYDAYWRSPEPLPPVVTETSPGARLCRCCNSPLDDRGPRALYCSAACRQLSYRQRHQPPTEDQHEHAPGR